MNSEGVKTNKHEIMNTETDYEKALHIAVGIPRFFLGQEVKTSDGTGIIVKMQMDYNGLYISPEKSYAVVWYGTSKRESRWVNARYKLTDLNVV
jgi:hypothetical protein